MMKYLLLFLASVSVTVTHAQVDSTAMKFAATITVEDLQQHLSILASDDYEGRETGMHGQKLAMEYLRSQFERMGIPPVPNAAEKGLNNGYEQPFALQLTRPGGISMKVNGVEHHFMEDMFYFGEKLRDDLHTDQVVLAGYGSPEEMKKADPAGRTVLVLDGTGPAAKGATPSAGFYQDLGVKAAAARASGARVMLLATDNATDMMASYAHYLTSARMQLAGEEKIPEAGEMQTIVIGRSLAEDILKKGGISWSKAVRLARKPGRVVQCPIDYVYTSTTLPFQGENVLAYIEGSDKKDEIVAITAHYDHLGKDGAEVYNGADDDGSGTVALLEIAQAFALAKAQGHGPRRSILVMPVSGEEKGLLGSEYYSEHPVFPLENTICDLNIDMVGRVDSAHVANEHYVYAIGSAMLSSDLHAILERANSTYMHLSLDYTFDEPNDPNRFYYRSDHYNFAKHGVPVTFFFNGVHEDYHRPTDEVEKIRFDLLRDRAKLVFYMAWDIADRDARIMVDKPLK